MPTNAILELYGKAIDEDMKTILTLSTIHKMAYLGSKKSVLGGFPVCTGVANAVTGILYFEGVRIDETGRHTMHTRCSYRHAC